MADPSSLRKRVYVPLYSYSERSDELIEAHSHSFPELPKSAVYSSPEEVEAWLNRDIPPNPHDSFLLNRLPTEILATIGKHLDYRGTLALFSVLPRSVQPHHLEAVPAFHHVLAKTEVFRRSRGIHLPFNSLEISTLKSVCQECFIIQADTIQLLGSKLFRRVCFRHAILDGKDIMTWECAKRKHKLRSDLQPWSPEIQLDEPLDFIRAVPGRYGYLSLEFSPAKPGAHYLVRRSEIEHLVKQRITREEFDIFEGYRELVDISTDESVSGTSASLQTPSAVLENLEERKQLPVSK